VSCTVYVVGFQSTFFIPTEVFDM